MGKEFVFKVSEEREKLTPPIFAGSVLLEKLIVISTLGRSGKILPGPLKIFRATKHGRRKKNSAFYCLFFVFTTYS